MHLHKQPSPDCLVPIEDLSIRAEANGVVELSNDRETVIVRALTGGTFQLRVNRANHPLPRRTPDLKPCEPAAEAAVERMSDRAFVRSDAGASIEIAFDHLAVGLSLGEGEDRVELAPLDGSQIIGFNGDKFGMGLRMAEGTPYYGFGERTGRLNKRGARMKFWNVDVCADHRYGFCRPDYDPTYGSIPIAIWVSRNERGRVAYGGVLIDNAGPAWFNVHTEDFLEDDFFYFGTYIGEPSFYFFTGETMGDVCRRISDLTGRPTLPPLWALGNHQCRWGYDEERMYQHIVEQYIEYDIPLSSLWLDIDYMQDYRVFTWHPERAPAPKALIDWMHERHVRLTTIIDPGVAAKKGDALYDEGRERRLFCLAPSGREFIGQVWPGKTVFPDFSLAETRRWWSEKLAAHLALGVDGIWNDMNDPSVGAADLDDMLFDRGEVEHAYGHNLYGNLMAEATWDAFRTEAPGERPFILTRSAATGIQRHAAVWTGDNCSSWDHLRMSIPQCLNLSLSGVSFTGPDIGGFVGDAQRELIVRWYQTAVLFPFFRNHTCQGTVHQEPWCFGSEARGIIRDIIILRYRLLGYLYSAFAKHVRDGEPLMRPLCYFSPDRIYRDVDDAYAIGDHVIVAPVLEEGARERHIVLPPGRWFDVTRREWREGGGGFFIRETPLDDVGLFVHEGTILCEPAPPSGSFVGWDMDLTQVAWRLHVFGETASGEQLIDDGRSWTDRIPTLSAVNVGPEGITGLLPGLVIDQILRYGINSAASVDGFARKDGGPALPAIKGRGGSGVICYERQPK